MVGRSCVDMSALRLGSSAMRATLCSACCRRAASTVRKTVASVRNVEARSSQTCVRIRTCTSASIAAVSRDTTASIANSSLVRRCSNGLVNTRRRQLTDHFGPEPETLVTGGTMRNVVALENLGVLGNMLAPWKCERTQSGYWARESFKARLHDPLYRHFSK